MTYKNIGRGVAIRLQNFGEINKTYYISETCYTNRDDLLSHVW